VQKTTFKLIPTINRII